MNGRDPRSGSRSETVMARFRSPCAERSTRIAFLADPHVPIDDSEAGRTFTPTEMLDRTVEDINRRNVDYVFSTGDLTGSGRPAEYDAFDASIAALDAPFAAIPGNHDVPKSFASHDNPPVSWFADRYGVDGLPFVLPVGDVDLIGLDTSGDPSVADSHDGAVSDEQLAWLDDALAASDRPIVAVHHNLSGAMDQFDAYRRAIDPDLGTPPVLRNPEPLVDVLTAHDVPLVVSGHLHIPMVAETRGIRELLVPTTCTFPQAYLVVDVTEAGTAVRYVSVATVEESRTAYEGRRTLKPKAAALTAMASTRLASFPLVDDWQPDR